MTYKKVLEEWVKHKPQGRQNGKTFWLMIAKALESADKYRWHDLRKNPKDLPNKKDVVLAFDGAEYGTAVFYNSGIYHGWATSDQDLEPSEITAWKYIPPFENEEAK